MKKILKICSPQLGLNPNSDLGGEVHDHFILHGLAKNGHKIFVYLPKDRPYQKNKNITVQRVSIKHIPAITYNFLILPYLFRTYKKERFNILRVHNPYFVGLGALIFKLFHNDVKIIATYHLKETGFIYHIINRLIANKFDAVICVSNYLKNWLINNYKVDPNKIHVIYNGVDPQLKPQPKSDYLLKRYKFNNKFIMLFIGLFIERKNPMFLLNLFQSIKESYPAAALIMAGRGPLLPSLKSYIENNQLRDVIIREPVFGKEKKELFNLSDVFMLPSKNEGFGLVVAEAMACAKPTIVANNTSLRELIEDGKDGFICDLKNEDMWMQKTLKLARSAKLRQEMGKNAHNKSQRVFTWQQSVSNHLKVLNKMSNAS